MNKFILAFFWTLSLISVQANARYTQKEPTFSPIFLSENDTEIFPPEIPKDVDIEEGEIPEVDIPEFPLPTQAAVKVTIGSNGGGFDSAALRTIRKVVGHAVSTGIVDIFVTNNDTMPIEGGMSFCAESGSNITDLQFTEFINELRSVQPTGQGTFYNIDLADSCPVIIEADDNDDDVVACTEDAKVCLDGSWVGRVPPSCEFSPCPEINLPEIKR